MTQSPSAQHSAEVAQGERFEFGRNWRRFLSTLNDERIGLAEASLRKFLKSDRLDGRTFLDIGSGSGLFSLAARRLGASVRSFDYDPYSVACTSELRRRYFREDADWTVEQGSALDRNYLATLGTYDIAYSWGVLHHTGSMWEALENVKPLAKIGGQLFIAIYNDLGTVTEEWLRVKQSYNQQPAIFRLPFALSVIAKHEMPTIRDHIRRRDLSSYVRTWTEYARTSTRGMSRWHDWIDWIGGYPYECATIEAIVDFYGKDGFALETLESRAAGTGCNEFVFRRQAGIGVFIDNVLPKSRYLLRQFGRRLGGPITRTAEGYKSPLPDGLRGTPLASLLLFEDGKLAGVPQPGSQADTIVVAVADRPSEEVAAARFEIVLGRIIDISPPQTIQHYGGHMYGMSAPEFAHLADNSSPAGDTSPVFVFEGGRQLDLPHSIHEDIVRHGAGRFSHWGHDVLFASSDNTDPRSNGRTYCLVVAEVAPTAT